MLKYKSNEYYEYVHPKATFSLQRGPIGVFNRGECWRLIMSGVTKTTLACFVTRDDGHEIFKGCYEQRLWTENEVPIAAERIIAEVLRQNDTQSEDASSEICEPVYLRKLHSERYAYMHKNATFTLKHEVDKFGRDSEDWCLYMLSQGVATKLACFVTADGVREDVCHECFSCDGKLWTDEEVLAAANRMIAILLE